MAVKITGDAVRVPRLENAVARTPAEPEVVRDHRRNDGFEPTTKPPVTLAPPRAEHEQQRLPTWNSLMRGVQDVLHRLAGGAASAPPAAPPASPHKTWNEMIHELQGLLHRLAGAVGQHEVGPVVRDHRAEASGGAVVRDHRGEASNGPVVRDHRSGPKPWGDLIRGVQELLHKVAESVNKSPAPASGQGAATTSNAPSGLDEVLHQLQDLLAQLAKELGPGGSSGPVVRDHRGESSSGPVVRDHRGESNPGPVVRDHRRQ